MENVSELINGTILVSRFCSDSTQLAICLRDYVVYRPRTTYRLDGSNRSVRRDFGRKIDYQTNNSRVLQDILWLTSFPEQHVVYFRRYYGRSAWQLWQATSQRHRTNFLHK